jgi:hypothetical protein
MGRRHLRALRLVRGIPRAAILSTLLLVSASGRSEGQRQEAAIPRTIVLHGDLLAQTKARVAADDPSLRDAARKLRHDADKALAEPIVAVTDKRTLLPPSGDVHDYYSLSPYWWPDPAKADGLPYIRRDGETNPESKKDLDQPRIAAMGGRSYTLAVAYYLTGDQRYAARAGQQLRAWFLDSATRMTPHLRFSQLVRGNPEERGSGIVDTRWFIEAIDASRLLAGSSGWSAADDAGLRRWMGEYLAWLRTTKNGKHEHDARNNHGSWYAAQTATYALFTGDTALARQIATDTKARIGWQITPDGQQPIELERTRSMHYSGFNAEALSRVAEVGHQVGVDLWSYQAPSGGSLRRATDHLARYVGDPAKWPGKQLDPVDPDLIVLVLRRAQVGYGAPVYASELGQLPDSVSHGDRSALLYPDP